VAARFEEEEEDCGHAEADERRNEKGGEDLFDLRHIDAGKAGVAVHELVGDADADDGTDHGVGAGGGQAAPPGGEVPEDGGDEESKDHRETGAGADLEDELDGQKADDGIGDCAGRQHDAEEVETAGVDNGDVGFERVGVDAGGDGVGGVVEAIDELEPEGDEESDAEQDEGEDGGGVDDGEVGTEVSRDVDDAHDEQGTKGDHAPFADGGFPHLLVEHGFGVGSFVLD
jgi:hypothetical protein